MIIGAGPAGLSAAVYLGRFLRRTVVLDGGAGRSAGQQLNENYLGFPRGVRASRLRELGWRQAERFGVQFVEGNVNTGSCEDDHFVLEGDCGTWQGRTVILATGVTDIWPAFPNVERYIGRSLFWCITCDGFRTRGKRTVLIGATDEAVTTACQFLEYTDQLTFITVNTSDESVISPEKYESLHENGIEVVEGAIERVAGPRGMVKQVFVDGKPVEAEILFSLLGSTPNSRLAAQMGVLLDEKGYVRIDKEQRTNVRRVYAAGDLTGPYAHQVSSAVHEGAMAAQAANYDLYADFQRE